MFNVIRKIHSTDFFLRTHASENARILNAGSSSTVFGHDCISVDIQNKPAIDCRCDVHELPFKNSTFDMVVITAVLQYCLDPPRVVSEMSRVLKSGGLVYTDVPFLQPYCPDTPDLFRFTKYGLMELFKKNFIVEECDTSIPGGSALAFYIQAIASHTSLGNRYLNYALTFLVSLLVLPLSVMNFGKKHQVAGAFYLIGKNRKKETETYK
jgi:SAM-dependent methyltransferase